MAFDNQKTINSTLQPEEWNNLLDLIPAGYTIYKKGTTIYAVPRHADGNVYSGENARDIIQQVVNDLTQGGLIFIKKGRYSIDDTITISNEAIFLCGEGTGYDDNSTVLELTVSGKPLFKYDNTVHRFFGGIRNMCLQCQKLSGTVGIHIVKRYSDLWFEKLFIKGFDTGIKIEGGTEEEDKVWNIWILDCLVEESVGYGIYITNAPYPTKIDRITIRGGHFYGNKNGIHIDAEYSHNILITDITMEQERQHGIVIKKGRNVIISNNRIFDCGTDSSNTYSGVYVYGDPDETNPPVYVIIVGNRIGNHFVQDSMKYGIYLGGIIDHVLVTDNALDTWGGTAPLYYDLSYSDTEHDIIIQNNQGFPTPEHGIDMLIFKIGSIYYAMDRDGILRRTNTSFYNLVTDVLTNIIYNGGTIKICGSGSSQKVVYEASGPINFGGNSGFNLIIDPSAIIRATATMTRLIDARDCSRINIDGGGMIDGNGKVKIVIDFTQSSYTVTHNRVGRVIVCGASDETDSCLINITGNSGFQLDEPWLDGRVGATGDTDSAHYGIILDGSGGQNTLRLGDTNNFFKEACIRLGGGTLVLIGGALEGGHGSAVNIKITSTNSGPALRVIGTWMESNEENILIEEGSYDPAYLDLAPSYMAAGNSKPNVRSTTTSHHLQHLRIRGGTWVTDGTYNLDVRATTAVIDKVAFGQEINLSKFDHYVLFHKAGWGHKFTDDIETSGKIKAAGAEFSSEVDINNNVVLRWKDSGGSVKNVLKLGSDDKTELQMYQGYIHDPANASASSVGTLVKVIKIKIGGVEYYIPVYDSYS